MLIYLLRGWPQNIPSLVMCSSILLTTYFRVWSSFTKRWPLNTSTNREKCTHCRPWCHRLHEELPGPAHDWHWKEHPYLLHWRAQEKCTGNEGSRMDLNDIHAEQQGMERKTQFDAITGVYVVRDQERSNTSIWRGRGIVQILRSIFLQEAVVGVIILIATGT